MAAHVAAAAVTDAATLSTRQIMDRFRNAIAVIDGADVDPGATVPHPVVGSVSVGVLIDIAVVEATVHGLDLVDAADGPDVPVAAILYVRDLLARIPDPVEFIAAATGRAAPSLLPVMR